jgi:hypothetical protein
MSKLNHSSIDLSNGHLPLVTDDDGVTFASVISGRGDIEMFTADELRHFADKMDERRSNIEASIEMLAPKTQEWFDGIDEDVYDIATARSEKVHGVGLTGLWDQGSHDEVAELVEEVTAELTGNN